MCCLNVIISPSESNHHVYAVYQAMCQTIYNPNHEYTIEREINRKQNFKENVQQKEVSAVDLNDFSDASVIVVQK